MNENRKVRFPLIAELDDLTTCLGLMNGRPLKLIANSLYKEFNETEWNVPKWSFTSSNAKIEDKKLLLNNYDTFQFSIANEQSKQDFHMHAKVFEIYVSYSKIEITYLIDEKVETTQVSNGVLIVPPGVFHKIKLYGLTFVFQAAIRGGKVHNDKQVKTLKS